MAEDQPPEELGEEEARLGTTLPSQEDVSRSGMPRTIKIALAIVVGIVIYAFAFEQVGVDLGEIQSETRQQQLVNVVRRLARPELTTTEIGEQSIGAEVGIGCDVEAEGRGANDIGELTVEPPCGQPGDVVAVTGTGFEPGESGFLSLIPESEFAVSLDLDAAFTVSADGTFSEEVILPDRPADVPQIIQATVRTRLGTWSNRVEVWDDTNENGIRDEGILVDGTLEVEVGAGAEPTGVALVNDAFQVIHFVSSGHAFEATEGLARGQVALPLAEIDPDGGVYISDLTADGGRTVVTFTGPEGLDVSSYRVAIYDGGSGTQLDTAFLGDQVRLSPRLSETLIVTFDKIIDTVLLALVATTVGLFIAVPLSFIAARNLMRDISAGVMAFSLTLLAVPVGWLAGTEALSAARLATDPISGWLAAMVAVAMAALVSFGTRYAFSRADEGSWGRLGALTVIGALTVLAIDLVATVLFDAGTALRPPFGRLGFLPGLFSTLGEVIDVVLPIFAGLGVAALLASVARRFARWLSEQLTGGVRQLVSVILTVGAMALWAVLAGAAIDWLYELDAPLWTFWIPGIVGAGLGMALGLAGHARGGEIRIGLSIYYIARTIFNIIRSIEPLILVIVLVIWVGFGEFAGALALAIHTAASLAKLYSEQVESILPGPSEAVRATGATRLQTVVYAVVPQVIPPYISFTMYRWDINVRLSTILGFAGGGGIGQILNQNVQLGQYEAASVQILAIVIVVVSMDWLSARLRERMV